MDIEDEFQSMNSELRFLTLELMKIAEKRGIGFNEIAEEYVKNVHRMQKLIDNSTTTSQHTGEPDSTSD